jgi:hypothetical protein
MSVYFYVNKKTLQRKQKRHKLRDSTHANSTLPNKKSTRASLSQWKDTRAYFRTDQCSLFLGAAPILVQLSIEHLLDVPGILAKVRILMGAKKKKENKM